MGAPVSIRPRLDPAPLEAGCWTANNMKGLRTFFLSVALCLGTCLLSGCATCQHRSSTAPTATTDQGTGLLGWLFGDGSGLENVWKDSYGDLR